MSKRIEWIDVAKGILQQNKISLWLETKVAYRRMHGKGM